MAARSSTEAASARAAAVDPAPQRRGDEVDGIPATGQRVGQPDETVHLAGETAVPDRNARLDQTDRVELPFVPDHVMLGGHDDGRRKAGRSRQFGTSTKRSCRSLADGPGQDF